MKRKTTYIQCFPLRPSLNFIALLKTIPSSSSQLQKVVAMKKKNKTPYFHVEVIIF